MCPWVAVEDEAAPSLPFSWRVISLWHVMIHHPSMNQPTNGNLGHLWIYVIHPHFTCKASIKALNLPILHGVIDRQLPPDRGESSPVQPTSFSWGSTCNETESASIYGGFGKHWGYQSSSIFMGFSLINHAAILGSPFYGKPQSSGDDIGDWTPRALGFLFLLIPQDPPMHAAMVDWNHICLVVWTYPLWKIMEWKSMGLGLIIFNYPIYETENHPAMFETTNQINYSYKPL